MALQMTHSFSFNNVEFNEFLCEAAGDGLPLHEHDFNHLTKALAGDVEVYTDDGKSLRLTVADAPVEYIAGRRHGVRALTAGARFMNIVPAPLKT